MHGWPELLATEMEFPWESQQYQTLDLESDTAVTKLGFNQRK